RAPPAVDPAASSSAFSQLLPLARAPPKDKSPPISSPGPVLSRTRTSGFFASVPAPRSSPAASDLKNGMSLSTRVLPSPLARSTAPCAKPVAAFQADPAQSNAPQRPLASVPLRGLSLAYP